MPKKKTDSSLQPKLIYNRNKIRKRIDHLESIDDIDLQLVELEMLRKLPVANLYQVPLPSARLTKDRAARLQELLNFFTRESLTHGMTQGGSCVIFSPCKKAGTIFLAHFPKGLALGRYPWLCQAFFLKTTLLSCFRN